MKNILISTGGSGGHVTPAISFYEHLKENFNVYLVSDKRGSQFIEKKLYNFELIDVPNIYSKKLMFPINLIFFFYSFIKSFNFLKKNKINILVSTGGYMSLPICIAATILKIKIFLFEPNMVLGRTNKLILRFSKRIICYDENILGINQKFKNKIFITKPLLRRDFYNIKDNYRNNISPTLKLLVIGGSQGSEFFDIKIKNLILNLSKFFKLDILQQISSKKKREEISNEYNKLKIQNELFDFDSNIHKKFCLYDLAITRSGASTISELCHYKIPFIAIPFPYAKDNHQFLNAKYYLDKNCCWIIKQNDFDLEKTTIFLKNLIDNQTDLKNKKENLNKISYQNTWNNINQKIIDLINEN